MPKLDDCELWHHELPHPGRRLDQANAEHSGYYHWPFPHDVVLGKLSCRAKTQTEERRADSPWDRSECDEKSLVDIADTDTSSDVAHGRDESFCIGAVVRVKGLQSRPSLNGRWGQVLERDVQNDRWRVALTNGTGISVRPLNLEAPETSYATFPTHSIMQDSAALYLGIVNEALLEGNEYTQTLVRQRLVDLFRDRSPHPAVGREVHQNGDIGLPRQTSNCSNPVPGTDTPQTVVDDLELASNGSPSKQLNHSPPPSRERSADKLPARPQTPTISRPTVSSIQTKITVASDNRDLATSSSVKRDSFCHTQTKSQRWSEMIEGNPRRVNAIPAAAHQAEEQSKRGGHRFSGAGQLFVTTEYLKEQVKHEIRTGKYDVINLYKDNGTSQKVARSPFFEQFTLLVIIANSFWIWIDTDQNRAKILNDADPSFIFVENAFCVYFVVEWLIRFNAFARFRYCFRDFPFTFDTGLVFFMVMETWIIPVYSILNNAEHTSNATKTRSDIFRVLRLVRLTRVVRMARLLRTIPELMILVRAIFIAFRSVFFTILLLLIIIYVFAVVLVQLGKGEDSLHYAGFGNVSSAMSTLLLRGNLPDHYIFVTELSEAHPVLACIGILFIWLAPITVMGMLAGVLVEVINVVANSEKESQVVWRVTSQLMDIFRAEFKEEDHDKGADIDKTLNRDQFQRFIVCRDAVNVMVSVGVDVVGLAEFCDFLFKDSESMLPFMEFIELVLQMRGSNVATVKDVMDTRRFIRQEIEDVVIAEFKTLLKDVESRIIKAIKFGLTDGTLRFTT